MENLLHTLAVAGDVDLIIAETIVDFIFDKDRYQDFLIGLLALRLPLLIMCGLVTGARKTPDLPRDPDVNYFVATGQQNALREAEIPYFSYRDMVWPHRTQPPAELDMLY